MSVINQTVKNDYCIGCGVCASLCPNNSLKMKWNDRGEFNPYLINSCKDGCGVCEFVCPNNQNIDINNMCSELFNKNGDIKFNEYLGYYLDSYVGYSNIKGHRENGASGGLATFLLEKLMEEKIIDKVITAKNIKNKDRLFDFEIIDNANDIIKCASSIYYPLEASSVLNTVINEKDDFKYAIVALPCVCYAIRKAMKVNKRLEKRIKFVFSLVCGQLQNSYCTELLSVESKVMVCDLADFKYRQKTENMPVSSYMQYPIDKNGNKGIPHSNNDLPTYLWKNKFFTHNACFYCDDIFGETADAVFMDAWLPQYSSDTKGTTIITVRSLEINSLINNYIKKNLCNLEKIDLNSVLQSQKGRIKNKRLLLPGKLFMAEKNKKNAPKRRVLPSKKVYCENRLLFELLPKIQNASKEIWNKYRNEQTTDLFWKNMKKYKNEIKNYEFINTNILRVKRVLNYANKILKRG